MKLALAKFLNATRLNRMVSRWEVLLVLGAVIVFRTCVGV